MDKVELTRAVLLGLYAIGQDVNFRNEVLADLGILAAGDICPATVLFAASPATDVRRKRSRVQLALRTH
jgi:hypothetical protein